MGFSVKKRDTCTNLHFFPFKNAKKSTQKKARPGQSQKKWDSSVFDIKNRDCPSKIGRVVEYAQAFIRL